MSYKYITKNNLYEKQTYMYSEYTGKVFLAEYIDSRRKYLTWWRNKSRDVDVRIDLDAESGIKAGLLACLDKLKDCDEKDNKELILFINKCVQSFEVRKRIYIEYNENWKPLVETGFEDYENYLLFAEILLCIYARTKCMKYLNCLLKLDDTLLSVCNSMNVPCREWFYHVIIRELEFYNQLVIEMGLDKEEIAE